MCKYILRVSIHQPFVSAPFEEGTVVTKIYFHFTFDQEPFKRDFIIMNQVSCQKAKSDIGKKFLKASKQLEFQLRLLQQHR